VWPQKTLKVLVYRLTGPVEESSTSSPVCRSVPVELIEA